MVLRGLEARPGGTEAPLSSNIHAMRIMMTMTMMTMDMMLTMNMLVRRRKKAMKQIM